MRLFYRLLYRWKLHRLTAREAAIEDAWRRIRPSHATVGDRAEFQRRIGR